MPEAPTILEAASVRVVFFRRDDRYAHAIEVAANGVWRRVFESLEGSPDDAWPPSPPFQSLHVERRSSGDVVLLVGMAGKTHWSAAVERSPDGRGIAFDVAARYLSRPERLGSAYVPTVGDDCRGVRFDPVSETIASQEVIRPGALPDPPATACWQYVVTPGDAT